MMHPPMRDFDKTRAKAIHPYAWLWEPLEDDASFVLRSMFGAKAAYHPKKRRASTKTQYRQ